MRSQIQPMMDNLLGVFKSHFREVYTIYVSMPMTTGSRYIEWHQSCGNKLDKNSGIFSKEKNREVVQKNLIDAKNLVEKIRRITGKHIIDPSVLDNKALDWAQKDYHLFWTKVIEELVDEMFVLDGWEYSVGCCIEVCTALKKGIPIYSPNLDRLYLGDFIARLEKSKKQYLDFAMDEAHNINEVFYELVSIQASHADMVLQQRDFREYEKDKKLDLLVSKNLANIAQFVSFVPDSPKPQYIHINAASQPSDDSFLSAEDAIKQLLKRAPAGAVNIRSCSPEKPKGNPMVKGKTIKDLKEIMSIIDRNSLEGKYSIVNEVLDEKDGGVSGVILGDIIEFAPNDIPKCVDKEDVCSLPRGLGFKMLETVYGFAPDIAIGPSYRVEFSIHPQRQGVKKQHTTVWEYEYYKNIDHKSSIMWPNKFSEFLGDKVFGLLVAQLLGILVPRTTVVSRNVAPFTFGVSTGLKEKWIRTCPTRKAPGKYKTDSVWKDPFKYINDAEGSRMTDEDSMAIASIISQDSVEPAYSGSALIGPHSAYDIVEGVKGAGIDFMVGKKGVGSLPARVSQAVKEFNDQVREHYELLGPVSVEWVYDNEHVWLVQLNQDSNSKPHSQPRLKNVIVSGEPVSFKKLYAKDGLEVFREQVLRLKGKNIGVELVGNVGITSHFGDCLRQNNIPSFLTKTTRSR